MVVSRRLRLSSGYSDRRPEPDAEDVKKFFGTRSRDHIGLESRGPTMGCRYPQPRAPDPTGSHWPPRGAVRLQQPSRAEGRPHPRLAATARGLPRRRLGHPHRDDPPAAGDRRDAGCLAIEGLAARGTSVHHYQRRNRGFRPSWSRKTDGTFTRDDRVADWLDWLVGRTPGVVVFADSPVTYAPVAKMRNPFVGKVMTVHLAHRGAGGRVDTAEGVVAPRSIYQGPAGTPKPLRPVPALCRGRRRRRGPDAPAGRAPRTGRSGSRGDGHPQHARPRGPAGSAAAGPDARGPARSSRPLQAGRSRDPGCRAGSSRPSRTCTWRSTGGGPTWTA